MIEKYIKVSDIINMLNNIVDRYRTDKLISQDINHEYPGNEVFIVDDVYEELEKLPRYIKEV